MDRINSDNVDLSSGKRLFTDGPPGTTVNDVWLNGIQEEMLSIIEGAGITPDANVTTQLRDALASFNILATTTVLLGPWDMSTDASHQIPHGISNLLSRYRGVMDCLIINDAGTAAFPLCSVQTLADVVDGSVGQIDNTNIAFSRPNGGRFDAAAYSGGGNRGYVVIVHTA